MQNEVNSKRQHPSYKEALKFWFRLGWISFGGTTGHIAIMHDYLVEQKRYISNTRFLQALNSCMILPGPEAQQLAIYIGWKLHGKKGGIAAGALFVLPSMLILLLLSIVYVLFGNSPLLISLFNGLKPAVLAIILVATYKVGRRALHSPLHYIVAALSFILSYTFQVAVPVVIFGVILLSIVLNKWSPRLLGPPQKDQHNGNDAPERAYIINNEQDDRRHDNPSLVRDAFIFLLLWLIPFLFLILFSTDHHFWTSLVLFFTKTACITIGGSYTVIPYVAQLVVFKYAWLSRTQMLDGFALAETTPGPLIIVLSYVGFMTAYNHFAHSILFGAIGLLTTTFYTFLPNFLFIFVGAPLVERYKGNNLIHAILSLVTATVVGVILNLTFFLGRSIIFPADLSLHHIDYMAVTWALFILLLQIKWNTKIGYIVLLSLLFGLARYWIGH